MSLRNQIQLDITQALKAGQVEKLGVLRFVNSQIKDEEIKSGRKELNDQAVVKIITGQAKKIKEGMGFFKKAGRQELVDKNTQEIAFLKTYLPAQLSDKQLAKEIDQLIQDNPNLPHPGALIGIAVKKLAGQADNKRVSQLVMEKMRV